MQMILLSCILLIVILWIIYQYILILPPNTVAILEQLGRYSRVLEPGIHILWPVIDKLHTFNWSYVNQENKTVVIRGNSMYKDNVQIDIPPIESITKDNMPVTIDVTVFYTIINVEKACYKCRDPLNMFYQTVVEHIRSHISGTDSSHVTCKDRALATIIVESVNKDCQDDIGIQCTNLRIQSVQIPKILQERNLELSTYTREHNTRMEKLRMERALEQQRRDMELEQHNHSLSLECRRYKMLQNDLAFKPSDIVELERVLRMPVNPEQVTYYLPAIKTD